MLDGPPAEARAEAAALLRGHSIWLAPEGTWDCDARFLTGRRSRLVLKDDIDTLVLDLHATVDPEALGATLTAVGAGGLVVVLLPPAGTPDPSRDTLVVTPFLAQDVGDRFLRRLGRAARRAAVERPAPPSAPAQRGPLPAWSDAQAGAVDAIVTLAPTGTLLLTGDRGAGKTSALGLAAARILGSGAADALVLGAPAPGLAEPAFTRLREQRDGSADGLRFELLRDLRDESVETLWLDEAAALPVPVLERLLRLHGRVVLTASERGFEGAGSSFVGGLRGVLDRERPGWREVRLGEPMRWGPGCPVEAFAAEALLLAAEPAPEANVASASVESTTFVRFDRDALSEDEGALGEVVALLTLAHTRTSPTDRRRLLDAPNATVSGLLHDGHVVAAALVAVEGGLSDEDAEAVLVGRFRPSGHMLPEILATHLGCAGAAELPMARVVRVAVHPALRRRGLGRRLMDEVAAEARREGAEVLGAGFGATAEIIAFWRRCGLHPIRLGVRRSGSSGVFSAIVLRSLGPDTEALARDLHERFVDRWPHQLTDPHKHVERPLAAELFRLPGRLHPPVAALPGLDTPAPEDLELTPADFDDLLGLAFGPRMYDATVAPVWKLVMRSMTEPRFRGAVDPSSRDLLLAKALDRRGWHDVMESFGFPDLPSAMRGFREALVPLVTALGREAAEYARARYSSRKPLGPPDASIRTAALRRLGFSVAIQEVPDRRKARMKQVLERRQLDLQIVLDHIWDPHNVAAILRSADAFAVGAIDLVYSDEQFPRISDMAAGYTKRWSLMNKHTRIEDCYAGLRARGLRIVATGPAAGSRSYLDVDWTQPSALVIGHERDGCSEYALEQADEVVIIPMGGFAQSLNVSVATAVILAEIARQRHAAGIDPTPWSLWHDQTMDQWTLRDEQGVAWKPIWPPDVQPSEGDE